MMNNDTTERLQKIDEFTLRLFEEIQKQKGGYQSQRQTKLIPQKVEHSVEIENMPKDPVKQFVEKNVYHIMDLMVFHDGAFIEIAYTALLRRKPDEIGREHFLFQLRSGKLNKVEILGRLRYSAEGKICKVHVEGLLTRLLMKLPERVPVIGHVYRFIKALVNLPKTTNNFQCLEACLRMEIFSLNQQISELTVKEQQNRQMHKEATLVREEQNTLLLQASHKIEMLASKMKYINTQLENATSKVIPAIINEIAPLSILKNTSANHDQSLEEQRTMIQKSSNRIETINAKIQYLNNQLEHISSKLLPEIIKR